MVGGLIGGGFAVLGMWITGRRERYKVRQAHERETLLAARQSLLAIEDLYVTDLDHDQPWELSPEGLIKEQRLLRELAAYAATVADDRIRELLELSTRAIGGAGVSQFQGDPAGRVAYGMCTYGRETISARLRGEDLPAEPKIIGQYRGAIEEADAIWRQHWEDEDRKAGVGHKQERV